MNIQYPRIDDATLIPFRAIEALQRKHPDLLERPDCPYGLAVREYLAKMLGKTAEPPPAKTRYDDDDLEGEITDLYNEIKKVGLAGAGLDPKDRIALAKTSSDLLTKLVALRERHLNIRNMAIFQRKVIEIMEAVLQPDQRSEFIERMGAFLNADLPVDRASLLGQGDLGDPASAEGEGPGA